MNPFLAALSKGPTTVRSNLFGGTSAYDAAGNLVQQTEPVIGGGLNIFDAQHNLTGMASHDLHTGDMHVIGDPPMDVSDFTDLG
jgi:hypothetical protein